ncbi:MAG: phosphoenolpyruvate synthase/pyruvate phosphate dikinase [Candidatus Magnetomorum sp.]|nr:phosphoenolpyruvate synthase/pyruvate phosphate dikinase [Candidatus Magnetomorum sp.]
MPVSIAKSCFLNIPLHNYSPFNAYQSLMSRKIQNILLVSSPYDAYLMEEEGNLASRIINEYRGLNLSRPPTITQISSAEKSLEYLSCESADMVITMPNIGDMNVLSLGQKIKHSYPDLPVILLAHSIQSVGPLLQPTNSRLFDRIFIWTGNSDLLLAIVKHVEDGLNVLPDTREASVRVLIFVDDAPDFRSFFLPFLYKEIVKQIQSVLSATLNEEHRLLKMRARPKVLVAENFDEAIALFETYQSFVMGVISDTRFPKNNKMFDNAGILLLSQIHQQLPDIPLLLLSSEVENKQYAQKIPATFIHKQSTQIQTELRQYFLKCLGFGDFVFRNPEGKEIHRANSLGMLESVIKTIPDESLVYHAKNNHFYSWLMGRSEIDLANIFRSVSLSDFSSTQEVRQFLISNIHHLRKYQQRGIVVQFKGKTFDADIMDFTKISTGQLGGKARGLAFIARQLLQETDLYNNYSDVEIKVPKTLVITTEVFETFVARNHLEDLSKPSIENTLVRDRFLSGQLPERIVSKLRIFLLQVKHPLSVRSSSLLEDALCQPYAGLYETYMIPNNSPDITTRLDHLITAIKLVYASTCYEGPKTFSKSTNNPGHDELMAVIIQELAGETWGDYFYPSISGVAQSHNFYPISPMKPDDGIAHIALGMGKSVVEGEKVLRFCPKYPKTLPQFSSVDDILKNAQRFFYALKMKDYPQNLLFGEHSNLERLEIADHEDNETIKALSGTYIPEEHRIRDSGMLKGAKILTFASILKYQRMPLPEIVSDLIELGKKAMGGPVEIEFAVNLNNNGRKPTFYFLQIRPMVAGSEKMDVSITEAEKDQAICYSQKALGHGKNTLIQDIIFVKPHCFDISKTCQIASEVSTINATLHNQKRPYILMGPGRWGSSDRWLGIPVQWKDISGVSAIVEIRNQSLMADPSQGTHFFQNITSLGIHYLTITEGSNDQIDWQWIENCPMIKETPFLKHVQAQHPIVLKVDGRQSEGIVCFT